MNKAEFATGYISVIFGPMFSGKSTSLLNQINKFEQEGKKVLVINYAHDNRYSNEGQIVTHDQKSHQAHKCYELSELDDIIKNFDVIAIDEGQFFHDIAEKADQYANMGKIVVVAALDATFERKAFNKVLNLVPIAEYVTKLRGAECPCKTNPHGFSYSGRKILSKQIELIGGEDIYEGLCRKCFFDKQNELSNQVENSDSISEKSSDNIDAKNIQGCLENSFSTEDATISEEQPQPQQQQQIKIES